MCQKAFSRLTSAMVDEWNQHTWDLMYLFSQQSYEEILTDQYLFVILLSTPSAWLCYLDDPQFIQDQQSVQMDDLSSDEHLVQSFILNEH